MSISLSIGGGDPLSWSGLTDLEQAATTNLKLGDGLSSFLDQPLSAVPPSLNSASLQYTSGGSSWTPGLGGASAGLPAPITFTLSGGVCGKVSVITSASLLTYTDGFPQTITTTSITLTPNTGVAKTIPVAPGQAFVALELDFQISGGITGSYQQGIYGVSTNDSAAASISVAFYKGCSASTTLRDACEQAFKGFVLPLHEKTLDRMSPGDYLHYNFDANLQLGVGGSIGYDKVFYAGTTTQAIPGTASAVTLTSPSPEIQAGAKFSFAYDYSGTFELLLWCDEARKAYLHLYRSSIQDTTVGGNIGLTLVSSSGTSTSTTTTQIATLLTQSMPDALQTAFTKGVLAPGIGQVNKYAEEVSDKLTSWLQRTSGQAAALDLAIEHTGSRFLLTDYTIDLSNPGYGSAWKLMLQGRFLDAMETAGTGVTLSPGSGVEALFRTAASVKLNLFGALHASWTETMLSNSSLVYAGNNVFHLVTVEGKDVLTAINATKKEITIYFAAEADLSTAGSPLPPPKLHCLLQATDNAAFGKSIAQLLGRLSSGPAITALAGAVATTAQQAGSTETLHLIFGADVYGDLDAAVIEKNKPDNEAKDEKNYAAFQRACAALYSTGPQNFSWQGVPLTYSLWRDAWIASNDEWPAPDGSLPNRRESAGCGSGVLSQLGEALPGIAGGEAQLVFYALSAAAQFMNLCDDLRTLAAQNTTYTPATWTSFVAELAHIVKNDLNTDFMPATVLALAGLCGGAPTAVTGPAAGLPSGKSIGVTLTYGQAS